MKPVPYCLALLALTVLWAGPARAAHRNVGETELLGAEIQRDGDAWVARGGATLHAGGLYLRADEIILTLDTDGQWRGARAAGGARLSLGSMYVVAEAAEVDTAAGTVQLSGAVTVYRDGAEVEGDNVRVDLHGGSVRIGQARGRVELPIRVQE